MYFSAVLACDGLVVIDGVGVQHAVKSGPADAQQLGGTQFVASAASQYVENVVVDDIL